MDKDKKKQSDEFFCVTDSAQKQKLLLRLKRIEGQIRGVIHMIEEDRHCDDVLNQIASVKAALNGVSKVILETHISNHLLAEIKNGGKEDKILSDFLYTLNKLL
ncbi:MAG: metal-sensing transcriptional repressor [Fusobacteriaceae bacterium]|jgi:DNA-binding FrmR family transcriptional regulator|nr:metal-sensing transcriptional repressor [Fusobacteriaceae bacterium]